MKLAIILGLILKLALPSVAQQKVEVISLDDLQELIEEDTDELKVINFWASWCGPCVREMPYFDYINQRNDVHVYLVSLDFPQDQQKAERMINKKGIQSEAYLLDEKNYDKYISSIDDSWSGAIPATLFVDKAGKKVFYEKAFEKNELEEVVEKLTSK